MSTPYLVERLGLPGLLVLTLGLLPLTAMAATHQVRGRHHLDSSAHAPAFAFGIEGGMTPRARTYRVKIDASGKVAVSSAARRASKTTHVSKDTLVKLLRLAESKGFFEMPLRIRGEEPMPDSGAAFITIHTSTETRTVTKDDLARDASFDRLFGALSTAVGLTR